MRADRRARAGYTMRRAGSSLIAIIVVARYLSLGSVLAVYDVVTGELFG